MFNDLNGNRLLDGPQELGAHQASTGGASTIVDPNLKNSYADELDVSFDRQFWGETAFRVAYVRKMVRNLYAAVNQSLIGQFNVPFTTTVNLQQSTTAGARIVGQQTFTLNDIAAGVNKNNNVIMNIPDALGGSSENYDTLEFAFNKRFGKGLFVHASYDYQWRNDFRNPGVGGAGNSNSNLNSDPIGTISNASTMFFQVNPSVSPLQKTRVWAAHLSARYTLPYNIGVAANYSGQAGWNYAGIITVRLPNAGNRSFFASDLLDNRADNIHLLALRLDKAIQVQRMKVTVMADLFNVMNTNAVPNWNIANGARFNRSTPRLSRARSSWASASSSDTESTERDRDTSEKKAATRRNGHAGRKDGHGSRPIRR